MSKPSLAARLATLPLHSRLFVAAFVCAHLAALGAAYAAALIATRHHELPAGAPGHKAVHHLGRMALVPLQAGANAPVHARPAVTTNAAPRP